MSTRTKFLLVCLLLMLVCLGVATFFDALKRYLDYIDARTRDAEYRVTNTEQTTLPEPEEELEDEYAKYFYSV